MSSLRAKIASLTMVGLIAAAVALLYAPHSGAKTRRMIGERGQQALDKTRQFLQETQQSANQLVTRQARIAIDEASALLEQGKEQLAVTRQKLPEDETAA